MKKIISTVFALLMVGCAHFKGPAPKSILVFRHPGSPDSVLPYAIYRP